MKKTLFYKIPAILMALILIVSCTISAFASEVNSKENETVVTVPIIDNPLKVEKPPYPVYEDSLDNLYMRLVFSVQDLNPYPTNDLNDIQNYRGEPYVGLLTETAFDVFKDNLKPVTDIFSNPIVQEIFRQAKTDPKLRHELYNEIYFALLQGIPNFFEGLDLPGLISYIHTLTFDEISDVTADIGISYLTTKQSISQITNIFDFLEAFSHITAVPVLIATEPGKTALKQNFPTDTQEVSYLSSMINRYDSFSKSRSNENVKIGDITLEPTYHYTTDGKLNIDINIYNKTNHDIIITNFDRMQIERSSETKDVIFDAENVTPEKPIIVFSHPYRSDETNNEYTSRSIEIIAEPGTFLPNQDLTRYSGRIGADISKKDITFYSKKDEIISDPTSRPTKIAYGIDEDGTRYTLDQLS